MASRPELAAATAWPGRSLEVLDYASSVRRTEHELILVAADGPSDNACWLPVRGNADVQSFVDDVVIDRALIRTARVSHLPEVFVRPVVEARQLYWDSTANARQEWVRAGKPVTEDLARQFSRARTQFKLAVRKLDPITGLLAKGVDLTRGGYAAHQQKLAEIMEERIKRGDAASVIESSFKTNKWVDAAVRLARTTQPVLKALRVGGVAVAAVELPHHIAGLMLAETPAEYDRALSATIDAGAAGTLAAACLVFSIGTGGFGLLACGVAPVAAGFFAGDAALAVRDLIR